MTVNTEVHLNIEPFELNVLITVLSYYCLAQKGARRDAAEKLLDHLCETRRALFEEWEHSHDVNAEDHLKDTRRN